MNEDFKYLTAIADHGSISKAAEAIHISQPGLSQRLKRIEAQMGVELFERNSQPLKPTASGEVYLKYARRALAAEENMRREVHRVVEHRRQQLCIGVSMARADSLLGEVLVSFYESHQGCTVRLREMGTLEHLHELFLEDIIDFAVLTPIVPDPQFYDIEVLIREQLVVVVHEDLRIPQLQGVNSMNAKGVSKAASASLFQLEGVPFILPACGSYFDPLINKMIEVSHAQLDVVVRDCSIGLALALVQDGLGAAIVPSTALGLRSGMRAYPLGDIVAGNMLRYVRRRDRDVSPEERLFMKILKEHLAHQ